MPDVKELRIAHLPSPMYGETRDALTPHPACSECGTIYLNTRGGNSCCPRGHGKLRTPVVDLSNRRPVKPEAVAIAQAHGKLVAGQIPNRPVRDRSAKEKK